MSYGSLGRHHHHGGGGPPGWMVGGGYPGYGYPAWQAPEIILITEETAAEKRKRLKRRLFGLGADWSTDLRTAHDRAHGVTRSSISGLTDFLGPNTAPVLFGVALVCFLVLKKHQ